MFRAAQHGRSREEEARAILRLALSGQSAPRDLAAAIRSRAALARAHQAAVATRNTGGFEACGVAVVDPWRSPAGA